MKLVVGLGNPGKKYENTRHNVGFLGVDEVFACFDFNEFKKSEKHSAEISEGRIGEEKVMLIKPQTFMNLSGRAVRSIMQFYKIPIEDVIVIYDDVKLPLGSLRIRPKGSAGGHNGMKSLIQELGTQEFVRVRIGIAPLIEFRGKLEDYVLGKFTDEEISLVGDSIRMFPEVVEGLLESGVEEMMQEFN